VALHDLQVFCKKFVDCQEWELVLLEALKWNISRVTPHDVLDHIIVRLPFTTEQRHAVRRHAVTFIALCITGTLPPLSYWFTSQRETPVSIYPSA